MHLKLPDLKIETLNIERNCSTKILGAMLDEHISWRGHIRTTESKILKKFGLLNRARQVLTEASLKTIYFPYIHSCLSYANIAWTITNATKLNKIHLLQKRSHNCVQQRLSVTQDHYYENAMP